MLNRPRQDIAACQTWPTIASQKKSWDSWLVIATFLFACLLIPARTGYFNMAGDGQPAFSRYTICVQQTFSSFMAKIETSTLTEVLNVRALNWLPLQPLKHGDQSNFFIKTHWW